MTIRKRSTTCRLFRVFAAKVDARYSDFDDLRKKLLATFPNSKAAMPALPPKSTFCERDARSHTSHYLD